MLSSHFFPVVLQKQLKREDEQLTVINSSLFYREIELPSFLFRSQPPFLFFGWPDTSMCWFQVLKVRLLGINVRVVLRLIIIEIMKNCYSKYVFLMLFCVFVMTEL